MRLLVVADIHGQRDAIARTQADIRRLEPDVMVVCGDISHFGRPAGFVEEFLRAPGIPTLAVPGNCDLPASVKTLEDLGVGLHGRRRKLGDIELAGLGGSNPTPFGTPFELPEEEIYGGLRKIMGYDNVLVTHAPPLGHVDIIPQLGRHAGSRAVAQIVEEFAPPLVLCGHIHEGRGTEATGGTTFLNPGPARDGYAAVVELEGGGEAPVKVELLARHGKS